AGLRELRGQLREAAPHDLRELLLRSRMEHDVRAPAHEILAESDLRIHLACGCEHVAGREIAEVPGDRRRADVEGNAVRAVVESWPDAGDRLTVVDGDRDRAVSGAQCGLQGCEDGRIGCETLEAPLVLERILESTEIARSAAERGVRHLDVVQAHHRVELDRMSVGLLAYDLAEELTLRRDVDDE